MYWNTIKLGIKNLLLHKLRSMLTLLGVILGVGSVISMLAITEGSKQEALERIRQLGANNVIIRTVKPSDTGDGGGASATAAAQTSRVLEYGLKYNDLERLRGALPTIKKAVPIALVIQEAQREHRRIPSARILGTTDDFLKVKHLEVRRGRFITDVDNYSTANVAVLAAGSAERLFKFEDPIGKTVLLGTDVYRVIGILKTQGSGNAAAGNIGQKDMNEDIYVPLSCAQHRFGELQAIRSAGSRSYEMTQLSEITLSVTDANMVSQTAAMARKLLLRSHPHNNDFEIQVPLELLQQAEKEKQVWNLVMGSIAGISLLVGGIGIMNIMLASVTERTREIGIRRAIGAKRWDITFQFLVETVLLSSIGGVLGVVLGVTLPLVVGYFADMQTVVSLWAVVISFSISVGIGIIFGIYPARRAAMMDPIQALRHQ